MFDFSKEQLQARFELVKAIRELIISEYADFVYEKEVASYKEELRDALDAIRLNTEEARVYNSTPYIKVLQWARILPKKSENSDDYEYLVPDAPVKPVYNEEFEKQAVLREVAIEIKATRHWECSLPVLPASISTFDSDCEFAFDFAIRHYDAIKNQRSYSNNPVYSMHSLSTFVYGVLSIDLSSIWRDAYDLTALRDKLEFFKRIKQNVVPKLEEVGVETLPFISSLEFSKLDVLNQKKT